MDMERAHNLDALFGKPLPQTMTKAMNCPKPSVKGVDARAGEEREAVAVLDG
ncbi:unnamed protein product, partial [Tilletia laevis]